MRAADQGAVCCTGQHEPGGVKPLHLTHPARLCSPNCHGTPLQPQLPCKPACIGGGNQGISSGAVGGRCTAHVWPPGAAAAPSAPTGRAGLLSACANLRHALSTARWHRSAPGAAMGAAGRGAKRPRAAAALLLPLLLLLLVPMAAGQMDRRAPPHVWGVRRRCAAAAATPTRRRPAPTPAAL